MVRVLLPVEGRTLRVEGERFHYLIRVLRLTVGDALEVFDGQGRSYPARLEAVEEAFASLTLGEPSTTGQPRRPITVVQALPKADKLEWILQKGTELGAAAFAPVAASRSIVKLEPARALEKTRRWSRIVEEASRQCGRSEVPLVHPPRPLLEAILALSPGTGVLVLDEEEHELRLAQAFARLPPGVPVALVVGPEGGLTREEVQALEAAGAIPVSLGPRVLRTETASLAALAVLLHLEGELG